MNRWRNLFSDERGEINYVTITMLIFLVIIVLAGWVYGRALYRSFSLTHYAEEQAVKAREVPDNVIYNNIREKVVELGIPEEGFELQIHRYAGQMEIHYSFFHYYGLPGLGDKHMVMKKKITQKYGDILHIEDDSNVKKYK